jgi:hypothetical protein
MFERPIQRSCSNTVEWDLGGLCGWHSLSTPAGWAILNERAMHGGDAPVILLSESWYLMPASGGVSPSNATSL